MLKVLTLTISVLLVLLLVVFVAGYNASEEYEGSLTEIFGERQDIVWDSLVNIEQIPRIKRDVEDIEILSNRRGFYTWKEILNEEEFRIYSMIERAAPDRLVLELKESPNELTGTWTYELDARDGSTAVTITEKSSMPHVLTRGFDVLKGRDHNIIKALKSLRVSLFQRLLNTP